jgi:ribosomal protein L24
MKEGYNPNKTYDIRVGESVIFSYGKYKNQEGEIIAVYPDRALIKFRKPDTLLDKMSKKIELDEEQIEVPLIDIAKKQ